MGRRKNAEPWRDYSLVGPQAIQARAQGLVGGRWYACPLPRADLKLLMQRKDGPAIRDTIIWLGLILVCAAGGVCFFGHWLAVPFFIIYGVLYGSASDSRWHECGHGSAFKTRWMNLVVYHLASFMILREPILWRRSHARHHADTMIVGRDPEIAAKRPPDLPGILLNLFALKSSFGSLKNIILHAVGRLSTDEKNFIPEKDHSKIYLFARIYLAILFAVAAASLLLQSWIPALLVGLPTLYGGSLTLIHGLTQHAGLCEDVLDHRLNCRTIYMNPVSRFLYWNMNYHLEHHMFPMVPYHALPKLHQAIRHECPAPYASILAAYREIIPALLKQRRDPHYFVQRPLPPCAEV